MPARTKQVIINNKTIVVTEKKVKELEALFTGFTNPFDDILTAKKQELIAAGKTEEEAAKEAAAQLNIEEAKNVLFDTLKTKLSEIVPGVTPDDVDEAYPSELEDVIGAFIDVNFTGAKKAGGLFLNYVRGLLARK